jgi:hypothetical protein
MKTLTLEAEVQADGLLHLTVPSGLPPGKVEVVIVVQPVVETNGTVTTNYQWLLDPKYENIGLNPTIESQTQVLQTRQERAKRMMELLDQALEGVTWEEIEEGREDRCF